MKEIYIRKMSYDEASYKLERELHDAFMAGEKEVEVIHGVGEGILKKMVFEYVKNSEFAKIPDQEFFYNPGSTRVEIMSPDSSYIKKLRK